ERRAVDPAERLPDGVDPLAPVIEEPRQVVARLGAQLRDAAGVRVEPPEHVGWAPEPLLEEAEPLGQLLDLNAGIEVAQRRAARARHASAGAQDEAGGGSHGEPAETVLLVRRRAGGPAYEAA